MKLPCGHVIKPKIVRGHEVFVTAGHQFTGNCTKCNRPTYDCQGATHRRCWPEEGPILCKIRRSRDE